MSLFSKVGQNAGRLFSKVGQGHEMLRKISNTVGGINKIGSFLSPMMGKYGAPLNAGLNASRAINNGLERAVHVGDAVKGIYN